MKPSASPINVHCTQRGSVMDSPSPDEYVVRSPEGMRAGLGARPALGPRARR